MFERIAIIFRNLYLRSAESGRILTSRVGRTWWPIGPSKTRRFNHGD